MICFKYILKEPVMTYYETSFTKKKRQSIRITQRLDIYNLVKRFAKSRQEQNILITLSPESFVIGVHVISVGNSDSVYADPKDIFHKAIEDNASKIITCHNHPLGTLEPSEGDIENSLAMFVTGKVLSIPVECDMIITEFGYTVIRPSRKISIKKEAYEGHMTYETIVVKNYKKEVIIKDATDVYHLVNKLYPEDRNQEIMILITLSEKDEVINTYLIHVGEIGIDIGNMDAKDLFGKAIVDNAKSIAVCYLRPSNNISPTNGDLKNMENMNEGGKFLRINIAYNVIMNRWGFTEIKNGMNIVE
jgi:DNA repair protein RadC